MRNYKDIEVEDLTKSELKQKDNQMNIKEKEKNNEDNIEKIKKNILIMKKNIKKKKTRKNLIISFLRK